MARNIVVSGIRRPPTEDLPVELVERKGLGHPDYIADSISEYVSRELSKYYMENFGTILHHNVDKVLVIGGNAQVKFGGGEIIEPIRIIVSGRATTEVKSSTGVVKVPIGSIILSAARKFIIDNFRFLNPDQHLVIDYKVGQGSVDLVGVYELGVSSGGVPLANDTSIGVGFAPLTVTERLVYETERLLNSREFKARYPEVGEDVKVMGLRRGRKITLTVASALVSRLIKDKDHYISVKEDVVNAIYDNAVKLANGYEVEVHLNTADNPEHGIYYLTYTGTSAEHGDDGMTGRGNRANGLITPMRPMSMEATAGKNPVSHIGKIYYVLANMIAKRIHDEVKGTREVYVYLLSQIGKPIDNPLIANVEIITNEGEVTSEMKREAEAITDEEISRVTRLTSMFVKGEITPF
ncbi:methionine adenosyltransferase [Caldivirga maquilingensis]|uniref:S-adenosylmethionine synthase n=1 Tax=Caldivirga maquilingensis (strain ATCC 700844 / DSM 13496 / JCM 10307 / IC-167) TaxID=397948 RepID=METK_CALMQ|nr:methionine adenosyltransferase [Caldivirga maquilingensis]A8MD44.1 RecName: Full=S-adenosylmethionine synthase; Short=AdoMet synthase; AltName: Full=Methionine adenosyltransferase [Caldivirga maquilingensis IC-167]ABW01700.1 Methionine adenosyltransferase [Caldivirga maquilingensis IC-167]